MDYEKLIPVLIQGMQEQQEIISEQQKTIKALMQRLDTLEEKVK